MRKRVLYFVYGVRKAVQNCLWLGLVLLAWHFLFDEKVARAAKTRALRKVTKIIVCLLVGFLLWLVKTLLVKVLASSFHMSTYFDRIQESLFTQYVIETLSGPPLIEIQRNEEEEERISVEVKKKELQGYSAISEDIDSAASSSSTETRFHVLKGRCRILLQVHDELVLEVDPCYAKEESRRCKAFDKLAF